MTTDPDDFMVTMTDVRAAGMCSAGSRDFCKRNNIDWTDFLKNGVPAKVLIDIGDPMVLQVVEVARGRK